MDAQRDSALRVVEKNKNAAPPHDVNVERSVIGCMLVDNALIAQVVNLGVRAEHFYLYPHRVLFRSIVAMQKEGLAVDLITIEGYLRSHGNLEEVGGAGKIVDLFDVLPAAVNIEHYVSLLGRFFRQRQREASALEAVRLIQEGDPEEAERLLKHAAKPIDEPLAKPDPKERQPAPGASPRAEPRSLAPLEEGEFALLVRSIRLVRRVNEEPGTATFDEMVAALACLVPFANGVEFGARWIDNDEVLSARWDDAVKLYTRPDRAGAPGLSQKIVEHARAKGAPDIIPISHGYGIWEGQFVKRHLKFKNGEWVEERPTVMTNFTCWVVCQELQDDGTGNVERALRIGGAMAWGEPLPEFTIPSAEWTEMSKWLHDNWGHKVVVFSKREHSSQVLEAVALYSMDAPTKTVYTHTGWVKIGGKPAFITANGIIGLSAEEEASFNQHASVALPKAYHLYSIPTTCTKDEAIDAYHHLESFVSIADKSVTAPMLSALFLAPLASMLRLSFLLAFFGPSDSRKSSVVAAAMTAWGRAIDSDHLTMSFLYTSNRIENEGFYGKDVPVVVDNYVPTQMPDQIQKFQRLAHTVGDSHARGRMLDGHRTLTAKPIRGLVVVTGEEAADKYSAVARMYAVRMNQMSVKLEALTAIQRAGMAGKLEPAMTHYITWLARQMTEDPEFVKKISDQWFDRSRLEQSSRSNHGRFSAQRVWINIGLELARKSHPAGRWRDQHMELEMQDALDEAAKERGAAVKASSITHTFFRSIKMLIDLGVIVGVNIKGTGIAPFVHADVFGWKTNSSGAGMEKQNPHAIPALWIRHHEENNSPKPWFVYVNARTMLELMGEHLRNAMTDSPDAIGAALEGEGILWLQDGQRRDGSRSAPERLPGGMKQRVLRIKGSKMIEILGMEDEKGEE